MSLNLGDTIDGKYSILRLLGEGGMGAVYEGENLRIHRKVAIKILHANVATSKDAVQRFEREAQAAGRIGSEHIVEVLDLGELPDGDRYMVMEFLDGESLNDRIKNSGALSPQKAAVVMTEMLEGLIAAHTAGIVHRDLKPDNIFLLSNRHGQSDFVKIVDFGISKFSTLGGEFSMTQTGAVMGTPYYLSPEQAKGERNVDHRADIYAAGVILWEATAGKVPFNGETFNELLFKIVLEPVPDLGETVRGIDPHFVAIVNKAMARDPAQRFQTAAEMQDALSAWLSTQPAELLEDSSMGRRAPLHVTPGIHGRTKVPTFADGTIAQATSANFANTKDGAGAPKTRTWIFAALVLSAVAIGGFFFIQSSNAEQEAAHAAAQKAELEAEEKARQIALEQDAERALAEAAMALAEAERARAELAEKEIESSKVRAALEAKERAAAQEEERKEKEAEARAHTAAAPRPQSRPSPAPAPTASPTGRKIRTDL